MQDDIEDADRLAGMLQRYGNETMAANDSFSGMELVCRYNPDVVLLDIGMIGYEMARYLKGPQPGGLPRVIVATCFAQDEDRLISGQTGIDYFMRKPIEPEELQNVLIRFRQHLDHIRNRVSLSYVL